MSMFSDLAKAAVRVAVATPVALVLDAVTLGGVCTRRDETYTGEQLRKIAEKFEEAVE